ncbi:hypothetical protein K474DRAFT_1774922 [Panus rudis PR-1116 ss-1]|nr:hypothetical protein K474DRAFT_1774922 [Panus rudis PR-1116 ss-1]
MLANPNGQKPQGTLTDHSRSARKLIDLNDDLLWVIINDYMLKASPIATDEGNDSDVVDHVDALINLSLVCRRLREACKPMLFHRIILSENVISPDLDNNEAVLRISSYVNTLIVALPWVPDELSCLQLFPRMLQLRTVVFRLYDEGLHFDLMQGILTAPNLETLVVDNVTWRYSPAYDPDEAPVLPPLRRIIDRQRNLFRSQAEQRRLSPYDPADYTFTFRCCVLAQAQDTMEVICMPSDKLCLSFLSTCIWKSMRELVLYGDSPIPDVPFISVIQAMPNLRVLKCLSWQTEPLEICPAESAVPVQPLHLQDIILRSVLLDNPFFKMLPEDVRSLSIRANFYSPRATTYNSEELLRFLRLRTFPRLEFLETDCTVPSGDPSSLRHIGNALVSFCPNIRDLTIYCYLTRNTQSDTVYETRSDFAPFISALSQLKNLRNLRLYLQVRKSIDFEKYMTWTIELLPWLDTIGFLFYSYGRTHRRQWAVGKTDRSDGSVKLADITNVPDDPSYGIFNDYKVE